MPRIVFVFPLVLISVIFSCTPNSNQKVESQEGCTSHLHRGSADVNALEEKFDSLHFEIIGSYAHYFDEKNRRDEEILSTASRIDFNMSSCLHMIDYYASSRPRFCSKFDEIYEELESCLGAKSESLQRAQSYLLCACVRETDFQQYIDLTKNEVLQYSIIKMEALTEIYKRDTE